MYIPLEEMARATALTREGRLGEATQAIQRALGGLQTADAPAATPRAPAADADVTDVAFRELLAVVPPARPAGQPGDFTLHEYLHGGQRYAYRLYTPPPHPQPATPLPVVVMLHGCKQDAADFARGTAMNELARQHGFLVLYPQQHTGANSMGCWNWFEPAHQKRDSGEPAMIASLTQQVVAEHGADAHRVYVAGLSAGGAMAALVGNLYPDVFAAVGVHSGLAPGSASDVVSAFAAMRKAKGGAAAKPSATLPTVVFHGNADKTVHPGNGQRIVDEFLAASNQSGRPVERTSDTVSDGGKRRATRTVYRSPDGPIMLEHWEIAAGPHAWSGGRAEGSFTDPGGPDASAAFLRFFLAHRRGA
jgi:poly(hydroxyalkanoate) depolymerase family esterase